MESEPGGDATESMPQAVFVSHASTDRKQALSVCEALASRGVACWIASRDVAPGANYQEAIVQAIRSAPAVVLVFSGASNDSDEIKKELSLASRFHTPVIALRIQDVEPCDAFAYELSTRQWIDAIEDRERAIESLVVRIRQLQGAEVTPEPRGDAAARSTPGSQVRVGKSSRIWLLAVTLTLAVAGAWYLGSREPPSVAPAAQLPVKAAPRSIAVLPLVNLSGNPENDYFSDGLAETLLDMLARVPDLTVVARTSSFAFKGKSQDVRQIGKALNATHLLEGSVQQSGRRLRIAVQLIRTADGANVWSQRYDRDLADVFAVQDEVATAIVEAMELALPSASGRPMRTGGTQNVEAYQAYLRGMALIPQGRVEDLQAALGHFDRAIELDARFALAYAMSATTLAMLDRVVGLAPPQAQRREQHIRRALQLDPNLGEAYIARADMLTRSDPAAAERDYQRGLALAPSYTNGYMWYSGWLAAHVGRPEDAIPLVERAIVIDPLDPSLRISLGYLLLALGRIERSESIADKLVVDYPRFPGGYGLQAWTRRSRGDLVGELRSIDGLLRVDPLSLAAKRVRCDALARAELYESARTCMRKSVGADADAVAQLDAAIAAWTGDADALARAEAQMKRKNPRFRAILARLKGEPQVAVAQLREQWPEWFKNPVGKPNIDDESQFIEVAEALIAAGDEAQARRVLAFGLDMVSRRQPGSGAGGGRAWTEAKGLALLGRHEEACAAITQAAGAGLYEARSQLLTEPLLAGLREHPCFAPAFARVDALAKARISAASKAGLL